VDTQRYQRITTFLGADVDEDVLLFDPARGMYYATSGVGSFLWESLARPMSITELCGLVLARYEVSVEACEVDVAAFVSHLHASGLVEVASE
jgi:hypothetical protein